MKPKGSSDKVKTGAKITLILTLLLFALSSCASIQPQEMTVEEKAYKILHTSMKIYNLTMESVAELQDEGLIHTGQRAEINKYGTYYRFAHLQASTILLAYKQFKTAETEAELRKALETSQEAFQKFIEFVRPIIKERMKEDE